MPYCVFVVGIAYRSSNLKCKKRVYGIIRFRYPPTLALAYLTGYLVSSLVPACRAQGNTSSVKLSCKDTMASAVVIAPTDRQSREGWCVADHIQSARLCPVKPILSRTLKLFTGFFCVCIRQLRCPPSCRHPAMDRVTG